MPQQAMWSNMSSSPFYLFIFEKYQPNES
uniref:Uncharacterized protein n=1 Tax=Rhizophora mucronata TaxID=61149 RepID=A0A2P2P3M5_RHIMU